MREGCGSPLGIGGRLDEDHMSPSVDSDESGHVSGMLDERMDVAHMVEGQNSVRVERNAQHDSLFVGRRVSCRGSLESDVLCPFVVSSGWYVKEKES